MGTSTSPAELAQKFDRLGRDLNDVSVPLEAAALRGKQIFLAEAGGIIGKTVAGKRKAIGARYDLRSKQAAAGQAVITYTGPAHLLNNPTRPHVIVARRLGATRRSRSAAARRRDATLAFGGSASGLFGSLLAATRTTRSGAERSNGAAALFFGGDEFAAYGRHPGTHGKHFFEKAREIAERTLPEVYGRKQLTEPLRRIF